MGVREFMRPGGLHPAKIGHIINSRYQIKAVHSNAWCPHVLRRHFPDDSGFITYLAKDIDSKYELLNQLLSDDEAGRDFIYAPMETFWIEGLNGKHRCLVYNLFTESIESSLCPASMAKRLAGDALRSLQYIHNKGICHADIRKGSFIMYPDIDPYDESKVLDFFGLPQNKEWLRKHRYLETSHWTMDDQSAPKWNDPKTMPPRIKLGNFLNTFTFDKVPIDTDSLIVHWPVPPELAFGSSIGLWVDIWFLALPFSTLSGMVYYGTFLVEDDDMIGPYEIYIAKRVSKYLIFAETLLREMSPELKAKLDPTAQRPQQTPESFQKYLHRNHRQHVDNEGAMSDKEYLDLEQLLKRMLAWEAQDRITAKEALALPFFSAEIE